MTQGQTAHWSHATTLWLNAATGRILGRNEVVYTGLAHRHRATARAAPFAVAANVQLVLAHRGKDIVFLGIEVLPTGRDALIRIGLLNKADCNSKIAVRDALYAYFEKYFYPETPPPTT
jgi:hypothetical protein